MKIKRLRLGTVNSYLISSKQGSVLIDTGPRLLRRRLFKKLRGENIRMILLTHGHYDHADNAAALSELTGAGIAVHPADSDLKALNRPGSLSADTFFGKYLRILADLNFYAEEETPLADITPLVPGFFEAAGIKFKILPLTGHTNGSVGILLNGTELFVGDAMMDFFRPVRAQLYTDRGEMEKSAELIRSSGAKTVYPGHGKPFVIRNGLFYRK